MSKQVVQRVRGEGIQEKEIKREVAWYPQA